MKILWVTPRQKVPIRESIFIQRKKQLGLQFSKLYGMGGTNSQVSLNYKHLFLKSINIRNQHWGTNSKSNNGILQRFRNNFLRTIVNALLYVPNYVLQTTLRCSQLSKKSKNSVKRTVIHPNQQVVRLVD